MTENVKWFFSTKKRTILWGDQNPAGQNVIKVWGRSRDVGLWWEHSCLNYSTLCLNVESGNYFCTLSRYSAQFRWHSLTVQLLETCANGRGRDVPLCVYIFLQNDSNVSCFYTVDFDFVPLNEWLVAPRLALLPHSNKVEGSILDVSTWGELKPLQLLFLCVCVCTVHSPMQGKAKRKINGWINVCK